jgi:hypothetical protein
MRICRLAHWFVGSVMGDFYLLQQIQQAQKKTVKQHHDKILEIIMDFLYETTGPIIDTIKLEVLTLLAELQSLLSITLS